MAFKLNIGDPKTGKCKQVELNDEQSSVLFGKKISDKATGDNIGLAGYEFEITGGSDYCGFPMRKDVDGTGRRRILAIGGVGIRKKGKGIRQRKTVAGNTIHERTSQVNVKILKYGKEKLFEEKKEEGKEEAKEEKKEEEKKGKKEEKAEKKEEAKKEKEEKKEHKKEEKPETKEEKSKEVKKEIKKEEKKGKETKKEEETKEELKEG